MHVCMNWAIGEKIFLSSSPTIENNCPIKIISPRQLNCPISINMVASLSAFQCWSVKIEEEKVQIFQIIFEEFAASI